MVAETDQHGLDDPTFVMANATARENRKRRIQDLRSPLAYEQRHHECDLVMKGGITSAVVYPIAISELATEYRFRNIGGTSAGAIAAAAAAAASLGGAKGFARLARMPERLGSELEAVFRPQSEGRRLLRLLKTFTTKPATGGSWLRRRASSLLVWIRRLMAGVPFFFSPRGVLLAAVAALPAALGIAALVDNDVGLLSWLGIAAITLLLGGSLLAAMATAILLEAKKVLAGNKYGLVGGGRAGTRPEAVAPLSSWLHVLFQELAGREAEDRPVTWGDLEAEDINLTLLTTSVSEGRTTYLPLDLNPADGRLDDRYFFDPLELRTVLDDHVIAFMCEPDDDGARRAAYERLRDGKRPQQRVGDHWLDRAVGDLLPMPDPKNFPILLATRMSLSFPVLMSAVPLHKVDWSRRDNRARRVEWRNHLDDPKGTPPAPVDAEVCWFSDGGIISNFPIHLFDSALPSRPTFGINLQGFHPDRQAFANPEFDEGEKISRPQKNDSGILPVWTRWETGGANVAGFIGAILDTMQNWSDNAQKAMPGYRDRIVHVSHSDTEGGLNLAMPADVITRLGARGQAAAEELADSFVRDPNRAGLDTNWHNHKWVRLRNTLGLFTEELRAITDALDLDDSTGVASYEDMLLDGADDPSYAVTNAQRDSMRLLTDDLTTAIDRLAEREDKHVSADPSYKAPRPTPLLRIAPGHRDGATPDE